ncbi:hypothetical protein HRbin33_00901 [bacterium HR33]|nr:hypothetical protein HRbin33_00901 [bacterium HR33]
MRRTLLAAGAAAVFWTLPAAAQHPEHTHEHGEVHSHRGPGPHFIDAFFTENAYIERKVRPDLLASIEEGSRRYTAHLEVEWALHPDISIIVHAPAHHLVRDGLPAETGLGDISVGPKVAVLNDRSAFILSLGADLELGTGDESRGLGEGHSALAPFLLAWIPFGKERRALLQTALHVGFPLAAGHEAHGEASAALSWTSPLGLTPILEGIVEFGFEGEETDWAVAPEFRWEFAPAWELGAGAKIRVSGPGEEKLRLTVGAIRHFPLPR